MPAEIKSTKLNIDIDNYLDDKKTLIDRYLKKLFEYDSRFKKPKELWDAVKYSLLDGGKRIRGILCLASCESINEKYIEDCLIVASSLETVHAMSLIHDDLPSMDNDDLRRGKPSCHKAFGEATAILAGDGMLSLAFELVAEDTKQISSDTKMELVKLLARAFTLGLVPGQILDLMNSEKIDLGNTEIIYKLKTAELIKASVLCGAIIGLSESDFKEKENMLDLIGDFGLKTGIAYQIIDDILDITGDTKTLGKTSGKDKKQKKGTYPMIIGVEKSKKLAEKLIADAKNDLRNTPLNTNLLLEISDYMIHRIN